MAKEHLETVNPATGEKLKTYKLMTDAELRQAVDACQAAFEHWRHVSLEERARIINAIGDELEASRDELSQMMMKETGKLLSNCAFEIDLCINICRWTAENGPKNLADEERTLPEGRRGIVSYCPEGIIYGIQPWNFPAYQAVRYSIASLMAGNAILLKHAEVCTGSGLLLRDIFERAGLPKELFTVVLIDYDQSDALIADPLVRGVTLTGSGEAGAHVAEKAGAALKKTVMELGSNDAHVVLEDADIDLAVKTCVQARLFNNGQTCVNAKRFVVVDAVYDKFLKGLIAEMEKVKLGDPSKEDTDLGPMSSSSQRDKLHEQVKESVANGAKIALGGEVPDGPGAYYPATILTEVKPGQPAYDDELFGPVASVIRAKDTEDAMRIANDSRYGLGGAIYSRDEEKAKRLAREHFDTGMVYINNYNPVTPEMPFGGVKQSGYGREHGGFGMKEFVNIKGITLPRKA